MNTNFEMKHKLSINWSMTYLIDKFAENLANEKYIDFEV